MSIRVLVVDDTVVFRRIVSDALAGLPGVEVVGTASNGRLALARMAALQPDLVTLDIEMPEMNGIEVLEAMAAGRHEGRCHHAQLPDRARRRDDRARAGVGRLRFPYQAGGRHARTRTWRHLRARLLPMIRAFERRREIRAILRGERRVADGPVAVRPVRRRRRAPWSLCARLRRTGPPLVLIGVSTGGPGALATAAAGAARRSGRAGFHRAAYAGAVHRAAGGQPRQEERDPGQGGRRMARPHSRTAPTWRPAAGK